MLSRPRIFLILAIVFVVISLSFPIQIMLLYGHSLNDLSMIINKISLINMFVITALVFNIPLLLEASPKLKLTIPITIFLVGWNNYVVSSYAFDYSTTTTTLSSLAFSLLFLPLLSQQNRILLSTPTLRWWQRPKRVRVKLHTLIEPHVGKKLITEVFDISETGAFVPVANLNQATLKVGDLTSINVKLTQFKNLKCEAEIVRISTPCGSYPAGVGLRFLKLHSKNERRPEKFPF